MAQRPTQRDFMRSERIVGIEEAALLGYQFFQQLDVVQQGPLPLGVAHFSLGLA